jgi:hypothetical protein|tara:strand:+ start:39 stop:284 length:246 start_codon:yes stop_codon:yes gene_type:complete
MKDKNIQNDYENMGLEELTNEANSILEYLEKHPNIENETEVYRSLLKLNNLIEKKFQKSIKIINQKTKDKIIKITSKKNAN